jgi:hypothetical protein
MHKPFVSQKIDISLRFVISFGACDLRFGIYLGLGIWDFFGNL